MYSLFKRYQSRNMRLTVVKIIADENVAKKVMQTQSFPVQN